MPDDRTVLHALPEDQPDSLGKGSKSNSIHGKSSGSDKPAPSDSKADWEAYASKQGIDTDGMTKNDIVDTVGS